MANEISALTTIEFTPTSGDKVTWRPSSFNVSPSGMDYTFATQVIGTSAEAIAQGEIGTPGMIMVKNMDASNFVEIGYDDTGFKPTVKILAGDYALFGISSTAATIQAKADTANVTIQYFMIEA